MGADLWSVYTFSAIGFVVSYQQYKLIKDTIPDRYAKYSLCHNGERKEFIHDKSTVVRSSQGLTLIGPYNIRKQDHCTEIVEGNNIGTMLKSVCDLMKTDFPQQSNITWTMVSTTYDMEDLFGIDTESDQSTCTDSEREDNMFTDSEEESE